MSAVNRHLEDLIRGFGHARVFDLEQLRYQGMPNHPNNHPGYYYTLHRRHEIGWPDARTPAAGLIVSTEHTGTHIDALCHNSERLVLFGGVRVTAEIQTSKGFTYAGAETIPPLIGRAVLLDIAAHRGVDRLDPNTTVSQVELESVAAAQGTEIRTGDVVLVRTGYGSLWNDPDKYSHAAGMGVDASTWLAAKGVKAVGADNSAWDVPESFDHEMCASLPGHVVLLARNGIYILEHLFLDELSSSGQREFLFVCLPLKLKGATGSPIRPIALVPSELSPN